ncbi:MULTISPECIES: ATP-binding cassette domain-containing protein [Staphylococcus]|uniref:ATP-binding cassette domain-containing protein n=3 Tax=Staphylococcus TaxID=1279 RepID=A0A2N6QFS2_9STAP|nr:MULTISPECIES: ATP-binding cassette domain-containing protein [Staphylococcus]MCI2792189.1 ATP-binding cassette domain-containing protein [Staphylococcus pettenkoferi]MCY1564635.1 ATP-binding cassette domain-containing protein [Staphylococcus pettenkoferi]MCY1567664.1 ATP-binding cassette domain-containing protein [Staphylococcus pettenkoferi]MCY1571742.1 ATP-binding cassette domain-containing protein [Staphylococcus pettenkoferi]MCY1582993.1 ATP-binding cassette domain-containing protein [S
MLELKDVTYKVNNRTIIDNLNLKVNKGDTIAIVGPSGSGKSTLLRLIDNLISPTSGNIYYEGQDYEDIQPEHLRMEISYLLQESDLFNHTIGENLAFPAEVRGKDFDKKRAKELLKAVGLGHYNLNTDVRPLSGGERQRVTIARQLMYIPKLLLLDEATSALDTQNSEKIEELIFGLVDQGVAIMWITHSNDQSMRHFKKRIRLVDGKIENEEDLT